MNWENITLGQFQDIYRLSQNTDIEELDRITKTICILYNKSEAQVDDMPVGEFNRLGSECDFLKTDVIPGKPVRYIRIGRRRYAMNYKPTSLRHRQYVEILHFSKQPIENMHLIIASLVNPMTLCFRRKNEAKDHELIANDMLNAPLLSIYHTCVFFCKLFGNLIVAIRDYLIKEMMATGTSRKSAEDLINYSIAAMDGFIQPTRLQNLNG